MGFLLITLQALANHLHQADIQQRGQREVLIKASLPAQSSGGHRLRSQVRQTEFVEGNAREVQTLCAAVVSFPVDALLIVAAGIVVNAAFGLRQQDCARTEDHGAGGTNAGASRLQPFLQPVAAQLALGHAGVVPLPLKTRDVIRAGDSAVAAADTFLGRPTHDAGLRFLVQSLEGTAGRASGIETLHALALHER